LDRRLGQTVTGPLQGLKVLDLTAVLAGPYATMLLADLGADVVKIEPVTGDLTRRVGPFRPGSGEGRLGGYFQSVNRGKRSLVLDLKTLDGRERFLELVAQADVVVENFSAGVMDRLGLGYETLAEVNPRLVYAAIRGFGDPRTGESPYASWPAFDIVAQATGGFLSVTGTAQGQPIKSGPGVGDLFPGALLAVGILAAVHHAEHTGEGQFLDVAMYDAVLSLTERIVYQHSATGEVPAPQGNSHPLLCPYDIFPTADGWMAVAAPSDRHWALIAELIGQPDMAVDERYRTNAARLRHAAEVRAVLESWLGGRTNAEVMAALGGTVPIGPVNDAADIFADPHVRARRMLVDLDDPGSGQPMTVAGQPIKFTRTPADPSRRGPLLDEDQADAVLADWSRSPLAGDRVR
jgi:crotonobetainyl-CoA:carnitine CoA-transferase CaiB-like acyl-CoA transferase